MRLKTTRQNLDQIKEDRGKMFIYTECGGRCELAVDRFHCADTSQPAELEIPRRQRLIMLRQLRKELAHDHQGRGCAGVVFVEAGVLTMLVCVRIRMNTRQLRAGLERLQPQLPLAGVVVRKARQTDERPPPRRDGHP